MNENKAFKDGWSPCPRCNSKKVIKISGLAATLALLASGSCVFWIGIFFPPLFFVSFILIVLAFITPFFKKTWQCQECKYTWVEEKNNDRA